MGTAVVDVSLEMLPDALIMLGVTGRVDKVVYPKFPDRNATVEINIGSIPNGETWKCTATVTREQGNMEGSLRINLERVDNQ